MSIETYGKSIAFLAGGVDACALWRAWTPYINMPNSGFYYQFKAEDVLTHDYVMVQRLGLQNNLTAMKGLRSVDMKIIYDLDDFLWDVPDWNPHVELLRQVAHGYSVCLKHSDVATVSTYPLKKAILKHHKHDLINVLTGKEIEIVVCPNKIDTRIVAPYQERDELIVGWAGSNTHEKDFDIIMPALQRLIVEFPQVVFEFAGWMPEVLKQHSNTRFRYWTPVSEFFTRYPRWGWSIMLAPLYSHPFNNCKSANKMSEAAAIGVPCLASNETPYIDWCRTGDADLNWLLCHGTETWYTKLKTLIVDEQRRKTLGQLCKQNVDENHSWKGEHKGWDRVFEILETL